MEKLDDYKESYKRAAFKNTKEWLDNWKQKPSATIEKFLEIAKDNINILQILEKYPISN